MRNCSLTAALLWEIADRVDVKETNSLQASRDIEETDDQVISDNIEETRDFGALEIAVLLYRAAGANLAEIKTSSLIE